MKRIIQIGILFVSLSLFFACGTTKVETPEDEQVVSSPEVSSDQKNEDASKTDSVTDNDKHSESTGERKPPRKPKKVRQKKGEEKPEEVLTSVIPVFDDWKYMGFGGEVPKELEESVKAKPADFITDGLKVFDAESRTVILHTKGLNVDQAESKLEAFVSSLGETAEFSPDDYEKAESGWVNLNIEYFTPKLQAEKEGSESYQALLELLEQTYIAYQIYRCVRPLAAGVQ